MEDEDRFIDKKGYQRFSKGEHKGQLVHRVIAYEEYLKNRDKYPQPFGSYIIHHKDRNKTNNNPSNLELLTKDEHDKEHGIKPSETISIPSTTSESNSEAEFTVNDLKYLKYIGAIIAVIAVVSLIFILSQPPSYNWTMPFQSQYVFDLNAGCKNDFSTHWNIANQTGLTCTGEAVWMPVPAKVSCSCAYTKS